MVWNGLISLIGRVLVVFLNAVLERDEPIVVKIFNPVINAIGSIVVLVLYHLDLSKWESVLKVVGLEHVHHSNLSARVIMAFCVYHWVIGLFTLTSTRKSHGGFSIHTKYWSLKLILLVFLNFILLVLVSERLVVNVLEPFIHTCAFVCIMFICYQSYRYCTKARIISFLADDLDKKIDYGKNSSVLSNSSYSFYGVFFGVSIALFALSLGMGIHLFFVVEVFHECKISFTILGASLLTLLVTSMACLARVFVDRKAKLESSLDIQDDNAVSFCQFSSILFVLMYFNWKIIVADDPSACTGNFMIGDTVHVVNIVLSFIVVTVSCIVSTINETHYTDNEYDYDYGVYNFINGFIICYMGSVITEWTDVRFVEEGYPEELDISIGNRAVIFHTVGIVVLLLLFLKFTYNVIRWGSDYQNIQLSATVTVPEDSELVTF